MENKDDRHYKVAQWHKTADELTMETVLQEPLLAYVRVVCDEMCPIIEEEFHDFEEVPILVPDYDEQGNVIGQHEEIARERYNPKHIIKPSKWPLIFANRLCKMNMTDEFQSLYDRYSECEELHTTLDYYSLNKDSYFYLCLWLDDYVCDWFQNGTEYNQTNRQFLQQVIDKLSKSNGDVTLSTGKGQKYKIHFDELHCKLMCEVLQDYMNSHPIILNGRSESPDKINGQTYRYWKFDKMLEEFILQHGSRNETIKNTAPILSTDFKLLVSRSLYAIGAFDAKKQYYDSHKSDLSLNDNFKNLINRAERDYKKKYAEDRNLSIYTQD